MGGKPNKNTSFSEQTSKKKEKEEISTGASHPKKR